MEAKECPVIQASCFIMDGLPCGCNILNSKLLFSLDVINVIRMTLTSSAGLMACVVPFCGVCVPLWWARTPLKPVSSKCPVFVVFCLFYRLSLTD